MSPKTVCLCADTKSVLLLHKILGMQRQGYQRYFIVHVVDDTETITRTARMTFVAKKGFPESTTIKVHREEEVHQSYTVTVGRCSFSMNWSIGICIS